MQHARINRVWVNLVSIHGVTLVRKYKVFVVKNCRSHPTMVRMLTKSKILQLTHCTLKNNGTTAATKRTPTMSLQGDSQLYLLSNVKTLSLEQNFK